VAVALIDEPERRDDTIPGPVVGGEDLEAAAGPFAADPPVPLEDAEPVAEPGGPVDEPGRLPEQEARLVAADAAASRTSALRV
jgi:hypothetical protein